MVKRVACRSYGAGSSILLDKVGEHHRRQQNRRRARPALWASKTCSIVKTDGTKLVAVQRTDLDINDRKARELAIADNRAAEVGLEWDTEPS
jgi:hypothetical protein